MKEHRDHNFEFSAVAAPKIKEDLLKEMEPLNIIVESLSTVMKEVQTTKQEVQVQGDSVADSIHTSFNQLFQIMEVRKQEMLEEAAGLVQQKVDKLTVQEKTLSLAISEVQSVVDYTERCVNHCTDNEVMSIQADIRRRIQRETQEHSKSEKTTRIVEQADMGMEVRFAKDLQQLCNTKAKITQLMVDPSKCTVREEGEKAAEVHKTDEVTVTVRLSNNVPSRCSANVTGQLCSLYNGSVISCVIKPLRHGEYLVQFAPIVRGRHELIIFVNDQQIASSPLPVFVSISPTKLGRPVGTWDGIAKPIGISINQQGEFIIAKRKGDAVVCYKGGKLVRCVTRNQLKLPSYNFTSIAVDGDCYMYLTSFNSNAICKLNNDGYYVKKNRHGGNSGYNSVTIIAGEVMACGCSANGSIMVYDTELNFIRKIAGRNLGELSGLAADQCGNIYVSDWDNKKVHVFNRIGSHIRSFGHDKKGTDILQEPLDLCVSGQYVYVCDGINHSVGVFTTNGEYVTKFGHQGSSEGEFCSPRSICTDADGFMYVCDLDNDRVQIF